ncbi:MAG: PD-(D/E)XK nuclease family protein [Gammaproteobacteria bacterium]
MSDLRVSDIEFTGKFQCFLSDWMGALTKSAGTVESQRMPESQFTTRLRGFTQAWEQLPLATEPSESARAPLDPSALEEFIDAFQPALSHLRSTGALANVWGVAGLGRNEVRIAGVLGWFLDCLGDHGQGHHLCEVVLDRIHKNISAMPDGTKFSSFPTAAHLLDSAGRARYRAKTEVCQLGEEESRVDIEINGAWILLFVEVKIDAAEGNKQIERYQRSVRKNAGDHPWGVVYLTPSGILPDGAKVLQNTVALAWDDIAHCFRDYAKQLTKEKPARRYIEQFSDFTVDL